MSSPKSVKTIYFAGDLFDHKHLIGNYLLASEIEKQSDGRYLCTLPQHHEQSSNRALDIRNNDFKMLLESDLAIFNFDGTDLDSGTVAEFMAAKFLDIPSVILRTDFRSAGDALEHGDNWNLMLSGYPRTEKICTNAMAHYQLRYGSAFTSKDFITTFYTELANEIIGALNKVYYTEAIFGGLDELVEVYVNFANSVGGGFAELYPNLYGDMLSIIKNKQNKSVYA